MANQYVWTITALDCIPKVGDLTDYCVVAHWTCTGTDGTYTGSVYNTASFEVDPSRPDYTPYNELTEAQVVGWVQAALGPETVAATYTAIDTQIENQVNPPIVTPPLPWAQPSA
jgi:hypothetical protein